MFDTKIFGERLKETRLEKDMSALQLGKALGFSDATIFRWENGSRVPCVESLYRIAKYFNVPAGWLIGLED